MFKTARFLTMIALSFMVLNQTSVAYGFQYGQCLTGKQDLFNKELKEYKNIALAKAAIKMQEYKQNPDLLKWNYETARLVYDLVVVHSDLIRLSNIYKIIKTQTPANLTRIQDFFDGSNGHSALAQVDDEDPEKTERSVGDLIDLLEKLTKGNPNAERDISLLRSSLDTERGKDAIGDLYDKIQEASAGATPVEPETIDQWIELATVFGVGLAPKDCQKCMEADSQFKKVLVEWGREDFPEEKEFGTLEKSLPPLAKMKFPKLNAGSKLAQKVVNFYYLRTMEEYLFSRSGITAANVAAWVKADKNHTIILKQANEVKAFVGESSTSARLFKYIQSKERVYNNAFDHFVWGQEGTQLEKSIDGVARTLYGEAESCHRAGASQYEAIGSIIAARAVSVDLQNEDGGVFTGLANFGNSVINLLTFKEYSPLTSYKSGASDFGRTREFSVNPIVSEMATPAQVVSRPGQFSVWKIGDVDSLEISRWISLPANLGYPKDMKTTIAGPLGKEMDPAQRKVLCPRGSENKDNPTFDAAVKVAFDVVTDYSTYANQYRFYQNGSSRVVPYFYTHGANITLTFVKQIPKPVVLMNGSKRLDIYRGPVACPHFKVYQPKNFKIVSPKKAK